MEHYIVNGGNPLSGELEIAGAKNAALGILAASVMTNETVTLENVPDVSDIRAILRAIRAIGGHVEKIDRHCYRINGSGISRDAVVDNDYVRKIRGSYYLIGSLLGKYRRASVALPGGCNIGLRPIDQHIKGVQRLHGTNYSIIPDQIEAGTFMFAAAATRGDVVIKNVIPKHLESLSAKLMEVGCQIHESDDEIRVVATRRLGPTNAKTLPYPGFPTDMQPQITVLLGLSRGVSIITESIFENRFKYVDELTKMGAHIQVEGNTAIIDGVEKYTAANLSSPDLRAGAALVIAALAAEGISEIYDIKYIERGYEDFPEKLRRLGAEIEIINSDIEKRKFQFKIG